MRRRVLVQAKMLGELGLALGAAPAVFQVRAKIRWKFDSVEIAIERFKDYLSRNGWEWLPGGGVGTKVPCPPGGDARDVCVDRVFRLATSKPDATAADAARAFRDAVSATGGLGRLVDVISQAAEEGAKKTGDIIEKGLDVASDLRCKAIKAATGLPCQVVYVGGGLVALGALAWLAWPVIGPVLAARRVAGRR